MSMFEITAKEPIVSSSVLTDKDKKTFDTLINSIICYPDCIQFGGRIKALYHNNPFTTIINETHWKNTKKNKFEQFITEKFKTIDEFNTWVLSKRARVQSNQALTISFAKDPEFNLVFVRVNNSYLECWAREFKTNGQVKLICNSKAITFYSEIVSYLRLISNLKSICFVKSDIRITDSLKRELNQGLHITKNPIKLISNNPRDLCIAYINLTQYKPGKYDTWQDFMNQFHLHMHQELFMAWIYGLFVDSDFNRQILWVSGVGFSGKSTVMSTIAKILSAYNEDLVKTITGQVFFDKFSLEGFDTCRLAIFADADEYDFFARRDVLTMTGGDFVTINRKNKPQQSKYLKNKIAVYSNYPPTIDRKAIHQTTRLLHVWIDKEKVDKAFNKGKQQIAFELEAQFPAFMAQAGEFYHKHLDKDGMLK